MSLLIMGAKTFPPVSGALVHNWGYDRRAKAQLERWDILRTVLSTSRAPRVHPTPCYAIRVLLDLVRTLMSLAYFFSPVAIRRPVL